MGVPVEGHFRKFDAQISLDPKKPETGKVTLTVDLVSATLGAPETDAELPKATWFNTAKFPQATFRVQRRQEPLAPGKLEVTRQARRSRAIVPRRRSCPVSVDTSQRGATTTATGQLRAEAPRRSRSAKTRWADTSMVADDVQVKFKLNAERHGAALTPRSSRSRPAGTACYRAEDAILMPLLLFTTQGP